MRLILLLHLLVIWLLLGMWLLLMLLRLVGGLGWSRLVLCWCYRRRYRRDRSRCVLIQWRQTCSSSSRCLHLLSSQTLGINIWTIHSDALHGCRGWYRGLLLNLLRRRSLHRLLRPHSGCHRSKIFPFGSASCGTSRNWRGLCRCGGCWSLRGGLVHCHGSKILSFGASARRHLGRLLRRWNLLLLLLLLGGLLSSLCRHESGRRLPRSRIWINLLRRLLPLRWLAWLSLLLWLTHVRWCLLVWSSVATAWSRRRLPAHHAALKLL
mmetsp:Transcript_5859/g.17003  ORF Transcript_5859/g.17003 Transcript_5859/m.17003 type:complete len:266 (+) Transcript_5859:310-1107(+)